MDILLVKTALARLSLFVVFVIWAILCFSIGVQLDANRTVSTKAVPIYAVLNAYETRDELLSNANSLGEADRVILLETLAKQAPLDPIPYEVELAKAFRDGRKERASEFAQQALVRNPRSVSVGLFNLQDAVAEKLPQDVIQEYERLSALGVIEQGDLDAALIGVFRSIGQWDPLVEYLKPHPRNGGRVVQKLIKEDGIPAPLLESLLVDYPGHQAAYLRHLLDQGKYERAESVWRMFVPDLSRLSTSYVFNEALADLPAPAPFNWSLNPERAELQSSGGAYVTYLGSGTPMIMEELISAEPGDYALIVEAKGEISIDAGGLYWNVACASSRRILMTASLEFSRIDEFELFEFPVTIPTSECAFQRLFLQAKPGEIPTSIRAEIKSVQLTQATE